MIAKARPRALPIGALVFASLVALSGCTAPPVPPDTTMSQQEAYDELNALFTFTKELVPGEWKSIGSGVAACKLPSGKQGLAYDIVSMSPGAPRDGHKAAADIMVAKFQRLGLSPTQGVLGRDVLALTKVQSTTTNSLDRLRYVRFLLSTTMASFDGTSRCVAGNPYEPNAVWLKANPPPEAE